MAAVYGAASLDACAGGASAPVGKQAAESATLSPICTCGVTFPVGASFCANCGCRRQLAFKQGANVAEMQAVMDGFQAGAAQGVFAKVKETLHNAAVNAVVGINENIQTVLNAMPSEASEAISDALGCRRAAALGNTAFDFNCKVGFHSNEQVICHLLHLAVQLAIFPHGNKSNVSMQAGPSMSSFACAATMAEVPVSTMETQTAPPPMRQRVGVRIGGGYHLVETADYADEMMETTVGTTPSMMKSSSFASSQATLLSPTSPSRVKPLVVDVVEETLKSPKMQPPWQIGEPPSPNSTQTSYVVGAPSDGTPGQRFRVAAHTADGTPARTLKQRGQYPDSTVMRQREGDGVQLSRYLNSSARREESLGRESRPRSASVGRRPRSASGGRVATIRHLREEAAKPTHVEVA